jgi:hypothetical protein
LKVGGQLFIISHGSPVSRKEIFKNAVQDITKFDFKFSKQGIVI